MNEEMKLYFEFDEYRKKHGDDCVDEFILEKIKALQIPDLPDKACELVAKALCDTVHNATENLKAILAPGVNASVEAAKLQQKALGELRDAIGKDEDIPKEEKKPLFKRFCSWLVGRSWEETKELATEVVEDGATSEKLSDDFKSSTLKDIEMPEKLEETIAGTSKFLTDASYRHAELTKVIMYREFQNSFHELMNLVDEEQDNAELSISSCEFPEIVIKAFSSDILSESEEIVKKLFALDCVLRMAKNYEMDLVESVIAIARDAFVRINDMKANIKRFEIDCLRNEDKED